jgi:hypothetical protein
MQDGTVDLQHKTGMSVVDTHASKATYPIKVPFAFKDPHVLSLYMDNTAYFSALQVKINTPRSSECVFFLGPVGMAVDSFFVDFLV